MLALLRGDSDFRRLWTAATVSMLGSFVTRSALPFTAILVLHAGAPEVAVIRGAELVAGLTLGLVAGAWIDRRRRRPVLIAADLGRAVLLGSIPLAAVGGFLGLPQLVVVAFGAAVLTTFFDVADRAFLPTVVGRERLVDANSALTATGSVAEFVGFGAAGWLVQLLTAPIAIAIDAVSFVASAILLGRIRRAEPAVIVPEGGHEPILDEIREGLRLTFHDPILRPLALGDAAVAAFWGVFGATYYVFVTELGFSPGVIGLVAAVGGVSSFIGAVAVRRGVRRLGVGRFLVTALVFVALGNLAIALAPDASIVGLSFLVAQQLLADSALTAFDVVAVSIRQTTVDDRALGRVGASMHVLSIGAMLIGTVVGGVVAAAFGVRAAIAVGGAGGFVAVAVVWFSRVRTLRDMPLPPAPAVIPGIDVPLSE